MKSESQLVKGRKKFLQVLSFSITLVILIVPTFTNATYTIGQQYNFSIVNKDTFIDKNGVSYTSENDMSQRYIIDNFNQTGLNYTSYTEVSQNSYDYLSQGDWNQYTYYSGSKSVIHQSLNFTDSLRQFQAYFDLYNNPVYPGWSQSEFNTKNLYISYNDRYNYFDKVKDNVFDHINVIVNVPEIIDPNNFSGNLQYMKNKINDMVTGNVSLLHDKIYNASSNYWYNWVYSNLDYGVAYTATLINSIQGVVVLHPSWIGRYTSLNYNLNPNYFTISSSPLFNNANGSFYLNNGPNAYYSSNTLNQKINDTSKYIHVQEIQNGLKIDMNVPFRVQNLNYFYNPTYSDVGNYSYHINYQYDSNGFLIQKNSKINYNANSLGQYIIESIQSINNSNSSNNTSNNENLMLIVEILAIPTFLAVGASAAVLLKRRKK